MDRYPINNDDTQSELELWEPDSFEKTRFDKTSPAGATEKTGRRIGGRFTRSVPAATAATFLVAAIAFGAVIRSTASPAGGDGGSDDGRDKVGLIDGATEKPADKPEVTDGDKPTDAPDKTNEPTDEPDKASEPTDAPDAPAVKTLELALHLQDDYVKVDWSTCNPDGFKYYKVVRSTDEHATWPLGSGDKLIAAIEDPAKHILADADVPLGKELFYRVFALAMHGDALVVACASPVRAVAIPAPTPKPEPTPKPTPKPEPTDGAKSLALSLSIKEGKPYVDWSECPADFHYYKVVRSTDSTVTWPKGDNDSGVAAVGPDGKTAIRDGDAPSGKKVWYRVFCVRETDGGWKVVAASAAKAIQVPAREEEPEPHPVALNFEAGQTDGGVALHWEACGPASFVAYKVVRSATSNPSYLPGTDGTQVIAVIENSGTTSFTDHEVEAGQTWYYRVQAIGYMNGHKILLGQTAAIKVAVE